MVTSSATIVKCACSYKCCSAPEGYREISRRTRYRHLRRDQLKMAYARPSSGVRRTRDFTFSEDAAHLDGEGWSKDQVGSPEDMLHHKRAQDCSTSSKKRRCNSSRQMQEQQADEEGMQLQVDEQDMQQQADEEGMHLQADEQDMQQQADEEGMQLQVDEQDTQQPAYEEDAGPKRQKGRRNKQPESLVPGISSCDKLFLMQQRKRFNEGVKWYLSALESVASTERVKPTLEEVTEMQVEVRSAWKCLEKLLGELQSKLQAEWVKGKKLKLVRELSRLQAEKDKLEEAAAADQLRFEAEKAEVEAVAQRKFEAEKAQLEAAAQMKLMLATAQAEEEAQACRSCVENSYNVVILPCSHAHYCEKCVEEFRKTNNTCPTCRTPITGTVRCIV